MPVFFFDSGLDAQGQPSFSFFPLESLHGMAGLGAYFIKGRLWAEIIKRWEWRHSSPTYSGEWVERDREGSGIQEV